MRPRRPVGGARQRGPQRRLQVDQLETRLRARIRRTRRWRRKAGERREAGWRRRDERRADQPLHLIDERALQVAPILVDADRSGPELGKDPAPYVAEEIGDRIRSGLRRLLLGDA